MSLPSQTCAYKVKITETSLVANAAIVSLKGKGMYTGRDDVVGSQKCHYSYISYFLFLTHKVKRFCIASSYSVLTMS